MEERKESRKTDECLKNEKQEEIKELNIFVISVSLNGEKEKKKQ
jgi:hypothetical protein